MQCPRGDVGLIGTVQPRWAPAVRVHGTGEYSVGVELSEMEGEVRLIAPLIARKGGRVSLHSLHLLLSYVTVSLGKVPSGGALEALPTFSEKDGAQKEKADESSPKHKDNDPPAARVAQQANTLMSLLNANAEWNAPAKTSRVWLGEGLGSIPKRVYDRMLRWEYVDMADFLPRSSLDQPSSEL